MKSLRAILAALFGASAAVAEQSKVPSNSQAEMMKEMRLQWLTQPPSAAPEDEKGEIVAVVMDWPLDEATVTVLASSVGDASVYTTGTFGILGGIGHERVKQAAIAFVECAREHRALAAASTDYSYPDRHTVRFFFVTQEGVLSVSFSTAQVEKTGTDAYDLYSHGQVVLTELRQVTEKQSGD